VFEILLLVLLYFLIGQLVLLNYLINYKPPDRSAMLGLQSIFWPLTLLLDLGLLIGRGLGSQAKWMWQKIDADSGVQQPTSK
jgi:hypothetical protein